MITGGGGQLSTALEQSCPTNMDPAVLTIAQLDMTDASMVKQVMEAHRPDAVINAGAYTAVDAAESDEENARLVNRDGAANLARSASELGARMVQISTDFVFDGSIREPRAPDDPTNPLSVYGQTKLEGEEVVLDLMGDRALVVRTAWLYSAGGANFVNTMLRLMKERGQVRVVNDQIGTPTWASSLAGAIWCMLEKELSGVHHWTDDGTASWHDFAVAIGELGTEKGILDKMPQVDPVPGSEFPTPARRPSYSVLDKQGTWKELHGTPCVPCAHWRDNLSSMLEELNGG
jgi:dTDP-4-dehydrorhamnose reductase